MLLQRPSNNYDVCCYNKDTIPKAYNTLKRAIVNSITIYNKYDLFYNL